MKLPGLCLLVAASLFAVVGCGGPIVTASGKLTYKGKPVLSTMVIFTPEEKGQRHSTGYTDDNGRFTLKYSMSEQGVLRGKHNVALEYYVGIEEETGKSPPKASKELRAVIAKYSKDRSPLKYEITHNGQFIEIDLQ